MSAEKRKPSVLIISKDGPNSGAGKALYRIHLSLKNSGNFSSKFLAWEGVQDERVGFFINENSLFNKLYRRVINILNAAIKAFFGPKPGFVFSHNLFPNYALRSNKLIKEADIIFLGWVGFGYVGVTQFDLFKGKKIIWRFSDNWPMTGGCHIPFGCEKFKSMCVQCPQLINTFGVDLAAFHWKLKSNQYRALDIKFIAPSKWMKECAEASPMLEGKKIYHVPTGVDLDVFKRLDKTQCKQLLGLDENKKTLLFGSVHTGERRKGFQYLLEAVRILQHQRHDIQLLVFGEATPGQFDGIVYDIRFLGRVEGDESLAKVYNATDVFLAPYVDDNLPNTVIEAIACGLPVVGFNSGGMNDLVENNSNGHLVEVYDTGLFAQRISQILENTEGIGYSDNSRSRSLGFSIISQGRMIEEILSSL
jgi:glycosyltransferase involved in cell wall biosynthesis